MAEQDNVEVRREKVESSSQIREKPVEEPVTESLGRWEGYSPGTLSAFLDQC